MKKKGIGSHTKPNNGDNDLWLTPPQILFALGEFDLDPCACPEPRPWPTAKRHVALPEDGLAYEWAGRVWCNPLYGDDISPWLEKMARHNRGIALTFARTETEHWTRHVWPNASAILFIAGRIYFYLPDGTRAGGNAGGPSALIAYGTEDATKLKNSGISGSLVVRSPLH